MAVIDQTYQFVKHAGLKEVHIAVEHIAVENIAVEHILVKFAPLIASGTIEFSTIARRALIFW